MVPCTAYLCRYIFPDEEKVTRAQLLKMQAIVDEVAAEMGSTSDEEDEVEVERDDERIALWAA